MQAARSTPQADALTEVQERCLWTLFHTHNDLAARTTLIIHYLPYARVIAARAYARRRHREIDFDDYLQFACVGLMESIDRFKVDRGILFKTFASQRMSGAILNGLEFLTEKQRQIAVRQRLMAEHVSGFTATGMQAKGEVDRLFRYLAESGVGMALGILLQGTGMIDTGEPAGIMNDYQLLELKQLQQHIRMHLDKLPERERLVIKYHYLQSIPFHEIAALYGLTAGRISQIHRHALVLLRNSIDDTPGSDR
ncbi:MAG: putative polymerase sigma factor [Herminiimonas sp.]|nr:putative polymerase sigma factor [Herminiimonas sp.]